MPYKTQYGSHYHLTYGCHGATIPCDANGLSPCSDCCGGGADGGSGDGASVVGPGSGAGAGSGEYSQAEEHGEDFKDRTEEFIEAFGPLGTGFGKGIYEITSYDDESGIAVVGVKDSASVDTVAEVVAGHFADEGSVGGVPGLNTVEIDYQGRTVSVSREDATPEHISQLLAEDPAEAAKRDAGAYSQQMGADGTGSLRPDPQSDVSQDIQTPDGAKEVLRSGFGTMEMGAQQNNMPEPRLGPIRSAISRVQMVLGAANRLRREHRDIRRCMRRYRCDEFAAQCIVETRRGERIRPAQERMDEYLKGRLENERARRHDDSVTYEDVLHDAIKSAGQQVAESNGAYDEPTSVYQMLSLATEMKAALEDGGYADKITPELVERFKREQGLGENEATAFTLALESTMRAHGFRMGYGYDVTRQMRQMVTEEGGSWSDVTTM